MGGAGAGRGHPTPGDRRRHRRGGAWRRAPAAAQAARALLGRAVQLGVGLIDTAEFSGPATSQRLIAPALWPDPEGLGIATTGLPQPPDRWGQPGSPGHLGEAVEASRGRLRSDRIELCQLARIDPTVPAADQCGALAEPPARGALGDLGLWEVRVDQLQAAQRLVPVAWAQNRYSLADRAREPVTSSSHCQGEGIAFLAWFPLGAGRLAQTAGALAQIARHHRATPAQVALAWLLAHSLVMLPIPGTSSVAHLEENLAASAHRLTDDELQLLDST